MTHLHALALIRNPAGAVLLTRPAAEHIWRLPGGGAHPGEALTHAAARLLKATTELMLPLTHVVALDQTATGITLVLDGGTVTTEAAAAVRERPGCQWVPLHLLGLDVEPDEQHRIHAAVDATEHGNELPLRVPDEPLPAAPRGHNPW